MQPCHNTRCCTRAGRPNAHAAAVHGGCLCCALSAFGSSRGLCDCQSCKTEVWFSHAGPDHLQSRATPRECSGLQGLAESKQDGLAASNQVEVLQIQRSAVPQAKQQPRPHFGSLDGSIQLLQEDLSLCHHAHISQLPSQPGHELHMPCSTAQLHSDTPASKAHGFGCSPMLQWLQRQRDQSGVFVLHRATGHARCSAPCSSYSSSHHKSHLTPNQLSDNHVQHSNWTLTCEELWPLLRQDAGRL